MDGMKILKTSSFYLLVLVIVDLRGAEASRHRDGLEPVLGPRISREARPGGQ